MRKLPRVQQLPAALATPATAALCRPADNVLAALLADATVVLWDLRRGSPVRVLASSPGRASCVASLMYGQSLAVGALDRPAVTVHPLQPGRDVQVLDASSVATGGFGAVAGRSDLVAALTADHVLVWSVASTELVAVLATPVAVTDLGFTSGGHLIAIGLDDAVAFNGRTFAGPVPIVVPPNGPRWPLQGEDGSWAAIAGSGRETRDLAGDDFLSSGRPPVHMLFHGQGRLGARHDGLATVVHPDFVAVSPWNLNSGNPDDSVYVGQLSHRDVAAVVAGPDGLLTFATAQGQLTVIDARREKWLRRPPAPPRIKPAVAEPGTYPAHRIINSDTAIESSVFWRLIEDSRKTAAREEPEDLTEQSEIQAALLEDLLTERTPPEIAGFDQYFRDRFEESYRTELWAVAEIIGGGCSDDGFDYFRCWLIGQGEKYYRRVLDNPQRAADRVRDAGDLPEGWGLALAARRAYERVTGQPVPALKTSTTIVLTGPPYQDPEDLFPRLNRRFLGD